MAQLSLTITTTPSQGEGICCRLQVELEHGKHTIKHTFDLPESLVLQCSTARAEFAQQGQLADAAERLWDLVLADMDLRTHLAEALTVEGMQVEVALPRAETSSPAILQAVHDLPWEGLRCGADAPTQFGYAHFVRTFGERAASRSHGQPLRVLFVAGDIEAPGTNLCAQPAPVWTLLDQIARLASELGGIEHRVLATRAARKGYAGRPIGEEAAKATILRAIADGYDVVHLIGRSAGEDTVHLGEGETLSAQEVAAALAASAKAGDPPGACQTRIVLLQSCEAREAFVAALTPHVDHVIGAATKLAPTDDWSPFYKELARAKGDFRVSAGVQAIRAATWKKEEVKDAENDRRDRAAPADGPSSAPAHPAPPCPWLVPIHFRAVTTDLPFGGEDQRARLIYAEAMRPHLRTFSGRKGHGFESSIYLHLRPPAPDGRTDAVPHELAGEQLPSALRVRSGVVSQPPADLTLIQLIDFLEGAYVPPCRSLVLLGDPGGGKTTTLSQVTFDLLDPDRLNDTPLPRLPLYVHLPTWADGNWGKSLDGLIEYMGHQLSPASGEALRKACDAARKAAATAEHADVLVLLDGFDELGDDKARAAARELLTHLRNPKTHAGIFTVLASRPQALHDDPAKDEPPLNDLRLPRATLRRLNDQQKRDIFVRRLGDVRGATVAGYLAREDTNASLRDLTCSPLFAGILADLALAQADLDEDAIEVWLRRFQDRSQFYEAILDGLIRGSHRWLSENLTEGDVELRIQKLEELADHMTRRRQRLCPRLDAGRLLPADLLQRLCSRSGVLQPRSPMDPTSPVQFWHRSLQEYLTARRLVRLLDSAPGMGADCAWGALCAAVVERVHEARSEKHDHSLEWWSQPLALVASVLGSERRQRMLGPEGSDTAGEHVRRWLEFTTSAKDTAGKPDTALQRIGLLATLTADTRNIGEVIGDAMTRASGLSYADRQPVYELMQRDLVPGAVIDQLGKWIEHWIDLERSGDGYPLRRELAAIDACLHPHAHGHDAELRSAASAVRLQLLEGFGEQDAPRVAALLHVPAHPDLGYWADIQPGWFPFGEGNDFRVLRLAQPFRIARVTVTMELYRAFAPGHWHRWGDNGFLPVTQVSWYEAVLFCRWLTLRLRQAGVLRADECVRLPLETEWEAAARGVVAAQKDARARSGEHWGRTESGEVITGGTLAAVACFNISEGPDPVASRAAKERGIFDQAGNVWEWNANSRDDLVAGQDALSALGLDGRADPEKRETLTGDLAGRSGAARVLRGGCFRAVCRAAWRYWNDPGNDYDIIGFRLVCVRVPPQLGPGE